MHCSQEKIGIKVFDFKEEFAMVGNKRYPVHQGYGKLISGGTTGLIDLLPDGSVLKWPSRWDDVRVTEDNRQALIHEAGIYKRLGNHARLVKILAYEERGIRMEYMRNGSLKDAVQPATPQELRFKWACQAAEAVQLLHSYELIHCDIKPTNYVLNEELDLKIIDFAFSVDSSAQSGSCESENYYLPRGQDEYASVKTDLFALGCTIYFIFVGHDPLADLCRDRIPTLYSLKQFPDLSDVPCREIIRKCFLCEVKSAQEIVDWFCSYIMS